jgi:hypothetical protein
MSKSAEHLYRCLDVIKADKSLSEETLIIMFVEYGKLVIGETKPSDWVSVQERLPTQYGKYEVYSEKYDKQKYETWNGTGWAYNHKEITHWRFIKKPKL